MGLKRKSKSNDTLFGSDDDEPIGTLLKLKGRKVSKKTKASVDGDQNKGKEVEKMAAEEEEELGGMDDTLANFRKKLKGTKKAGGSVVAEGKDTSTSVVEPLCESRTASAKRIGVYPNSVSGLHQKDQGNTEAGSSGDVTVIDGLKEKSKIKNKRVKISSDTKVFGRNFELGDGLDHQMSENCELEQDIEGAAESGDEALEDSLFSFFQKAQSGMISKSHSSRLKQERETTVSDDGSIPYSAIVSEAPVGKSQSASKLEKFPLPGDSLQTAPGQGSITSTLSCRSVDDRMLESLDFTSGSSVTKQVCSSTPLKTIQIEESSNNMDSVVKVISGNSASISMVPKSPSSLRVCSGMISEALGGTVISEAPANQPGLRIGSSNILHRTYEVSCCVKTGETALHTFQEPILDKKCGEEDSGDDVDPQFNLTTLTVPDRETELSTSLSESQKTGDVVKQVWGRDTEGHPMYVDKVQHHLSHYPVDRLQKDLPSGGHDCPFRSLVNCSRERDPSSVSSQEKVDHKSEYRSSSPVAVCENLKYVVPFQVNRENESQNIVDESEQVLEPSLIFQEAASLPNFDYPSGDEEVNGTSYSSIMMDQGSCPEDRGSFDDPETKESCRSVIQRAARNARKLRHGDMAYEGDVDWEGLMQGQEFFVSHEELDKTKEKFNASFMHVDAENGKAAAVSVGLKARAVGPIEKIKFKEVLKRKGGLQEYLECRNHILGVWNKDVSRILQLSDFGVSDAYLVGESPRASLVRDIYIFLDQRGYINFGVPFEKKKAENYINNDLKLLPEKQGEHFGHSTVDSENVDPVVLEKQKSSETCIGGNNDNLFIDEKRAENLETEDGLVNLRAAESSVPSISEDNSPDRSKIINDLEHMSLIPLHEDKNGSALNAAPPALPSRGEAVPAIPSELPEARSDVLSPSMDCAHSDAQCYAGPRKTIIIVGAGPAGLAAARHLQRQGFSVTVLEARPRIGGRVYTDHSSLSVPVDLGASIITGVEADVATERRPDPSSLICAQLGLKLTVLNSECPLYDTVTRQKVPADLDEALEAEYNSLLDDAELLVAEKGEPALNMSLEEGLEYALKRRSSNYGLMPVKSINTSVAAEGFAINDVISSAPDSKAGGLSPLERRVMDWHFAHLEYGCAALLKEVSLPNWNQDDLYGGFGGAHCMIKGGYSAVVESLREGICVHLDHVVKDIIYYPKDRGTNNDLDDKVKVCTSNGKEFAGDAVLVTVPLGCLKANTIKFSPPLPQWKYLAIKRLGFGVLNKVILEFPEVFWDDSVDYFGATAEETDQRGRCFMFWNVKKTVGAPVLVALLVGKAAVDGQNISSSDHVAHALCVLRKVFGEDQVLDPVASVVTDWGNDPYSYGAYSYVAVGSSGEDYDTLGRPVNNCIFFAGEATCKEHPDTVGGAMMSGLREAVRIADILNSGTDYTAEVEAMEAAKRHSNTERSEVKDIARKLDAIEFSGAVYTSSLDGSQSSAWGSMLKDMFFTAKTTAGRLHLAKELLNLPVGFLKTFAGTKEGLSALNSWILDSMGKDGTQLLRHCVRLLVLVSNDLLAVRLSGVGKTVKEKVCVHTSRDIRAIASQLVKVWVDLFRKEKAAKGGHSTSGDPKGKSSQVHGRPPLRTNYVMPKTKKSAGYQFSSSASSKKVIDKSVKLETRSDQISDVQPPNTHVSTGCGNNEEESCEIPMSEEEKAAFAVAEAARSAAIAAAKAYASSGAMHNSLPQLPKILSFNKFAMREQYTHMDELDSRKNWSGAAIGKPDCFSEIDSRNCRVRDWAVDFSAAGVNLENSKMPADNHSQRSHSNEVASQLNFREHSGESVALDNNILTKAWVDSSGSIGLKDYNAIERWQCQAAAASSGFSHETRHIIDEEESNLASKLHGQKHDEPTNGSSDSQVITNRESKGNQSRGAEHIKQAVVDYVASLLMPLYKARKIDKEGYKLIMKKTATKVMERATDAEKAMAVTEFLDFKRKNKIRAFVDMMIERHLAMKPDA